MFARKPDDGGFRAPISMSGHINAQIATARYRGIVVDRSGSPVVNQQASVQHVRSIASVKASWIGQAASWPSSAVPAGYQNMGGKQERRVSWHVMDTRIRILQHLSPMIRPIGLACLISVKQRVMVEQRLKQ